MDGEPPKVAVEGGLALERTKLAEERTHLAYIRTGISLALGGLFFVGYFEHGTFFSYIGYITIVLALAFTGYGFYSHEKTHRAIKEMSMGLIDLKKK